jgi:hypothetical protein
MIQYPLDGRESVLRHIFLPLLDCLRWGHEEGLAAVYDKGEVFYIILVALDDLFCAGDCCPPVVTRGLDGGRVTRHRHDLTGL